MNKLLFLISFIVLFSCKRNNKNKIELKILSSSITSKSNLDSLIYSNSDEYFYKNRGNSVLRFSISNTTNINYLIILRNVFDTYNGINTIEGKNLDLDFLQIMNPQKTDTIKVHYAFSYPMPNKDELEQFIENNKNKIQIFNSLNYYKTINWIDKNEIITNNLIYLKSNEIKYFETFVNLPYSEASNGSSYVKLDSTKNYIANLKFTSDTINIKKHLTWSQLKNIEDNNYKLYHGTIISENSVPLVFVK